MCRRTAVMIAHWMRVGFVHGVMNTDNMSVLGLTIDYGPYGWLEDYDPDWTPNTTDAGGRRYRYAYQPMIALWNLGRFGGALLPLVDGASRDGRRAQRDCRVARGRAVAELGRKVRPRAPMPPTTALVEELPALLRLAETDMTIFFRDLADLEASPDALRSASDDDLIAPLIDAYYAPEKLDADARAKTGAWLRRYLARVLHEGVSQETRRARMNAVNPKYVLRNYLAQLAIDKAEQGDASMVNELLDVLRTPYAEQPGREAFAAKRPEWARHRPGCSMLSCSS